MRTFEYVEQGWNGGPVTVRKTEQEILEMYFPYWSEQMKRAGKEDQITREACLTDWVVVNWAHEVQT